MKPIGSIESETNPSNPEATTTTTTTISRKAKQNKTKKKQIAIHTTYAGWPELQAMD